MLWDGAEQRWTNRYVSLPVINGQKLILVPKASVRWKLAFSHHADRAKTACVDGFAHLGDG
jgi:hypothetical protein